MDNQYLQRYLNIFKSHTGQEFTEKKLDISMVDLGINSFMVIELMIVIEAEFGIELPDSLINPDLFYSPKTLFEGLMVAINMSIDK